ncbi:MAG TPA: hypothetical protein VGT03_10340 [Candidatus Acidoferrales bacterium]|nr:hypothetical protein [Candidatus Acidoferrales bacterium]
MRRGAILLGSFLWACLVLASCGSSPKQVQPLAITSISPSTLPAGSPGFQLAISGTDLTNGTFFSFGSDSKIAPFVVLQDPCPTAPCPQTALLQIPPNDIAAAGTAKVIANTEGASSNAVTFAITSPQVVTMSPLAATAGEPAFNLTLEVLNAGQSVQVLFGKDPMPLVPAGPVTCNPVTACAVTVTVPAADIKTAGPLTVTVANPFATAGGTVNTNFLVVNPGAGPFPALESVNGTTPADGVSTHSSASDGGVFVAFDSTATKLVSGATSGHSEIYLRTNCFGAANCTTGTTLVSAGSGGAEGAGGVNGSDRPAISPDGRFIVYESDDTNLVANATAVTEQIYLFDSCNSIFGAVQNCKPSTTLVSLGTDGNPGNAPSANPSISAFGLYVAYHSAAINLTSTPVNSGTQQVYLFLSCNGAAGAITGCKPTTQLLSFNQSSSAGDFSSVNAVIDPLGMSVAFESLADNIVAPVSANGFQQIYVRSTCLEGDPFLGPGCTQISVLVSGTSGNQSGTADSVTPAIAVGPIVEYATRAANLFPPASSTEQILATNVCLGLPGTTQCSPSGTLALSVDSSGAAFSAGDNLHPSVNGVTAAFTGVQSSTTGQQVYAATVCLPVMAPCAPTATVISASGGSNIGGDFASVGAGGFATFSSAGSSIAPGTPEIFIAIPPAPAGAAPVAKLRKSKPE